MLKIKLVSSGRPSWNVTYGNSHQCNYLNCIKLSKQVRDRRSNFWEQLMPVEVIPSYTDFSSTSHGYFLTQECHQEKDKGSSKAERKRQSHIPQKSPKYPIISHPCHAVPGGNSKIQDTAKMTQTGREDEPKVPAPILAPSHCPLPGDPR